MTENFSFESLEVYKRALLFASGACKITNSFPYQYSRMRDQLIGATISIPLNIAEGYGRNSPKDQNHFFSMGRASAFECVPIVNICLEVNLINKINYEKLRKEIAEISRMLAGLMRSKKIYLSQTSNLKPQISNL